MIKYPIFLTVLMLMVWGCNDGKTSTDNEQVPDDGVTDNTVTDETTDDDQSDPTDQPDQTTDDGAAVTDDGIVETDDGQGVNDDGTVVTDDSLLLDEDATDDLLTDDALIVDDDPIFTDDDLSDEEDLSDDEDTETLTDADLAPGTKTCYQINDCVYMCPDEDVDCSLKCVQSGSLEGREQYQTVMDCLDDNCSTECAPDLNAPSCEECLDDHCHTELLSCYFGQDDVPAYGILKGDQTSFAHIYDGDGDLSAQMQADLSGLVFSAVFTGAYGTGYHPVPPAADLTTAFAVHYAEEIPSSPAHISIEQRSTVEQELVDPVVVLSFRTDDLQPGSFTVDPTQMNGADLYLFNYNGTSTYCILAMGFSGTVNVTAAVNTTAASGGSIALNTTDIKIYHPTETPIGDLSYQFATCPRE